MASPSGSSPTDASISFARDDILEDTPSTLDETPCALIVILYIDVMVGVEDWTYHTETFPGKLLGDSYNSTYMQTQRVFYDSYCCNFHHRRQPSRDALDPHKFLSWEPLFDASQQPAKSL